MIWLVRGCRVASAAALPCRAKEEPGADARGRDLDAPGPSTRSFAARGINRTMPRYWVVRTNVNVVSEVIVPSLDAGELRQGWGYRDDQDLNVIGPIVNDEGRSALHDDQKATWRRVQRF